MSTPMWKKFEQLVAKVQQDLPSQAIVTAIKEKMIRTDIHNSWHF